VSNNSDGDHTAAIRLQSGQTKAIFEESAFDTGLLGIQTSRANFTQYQVRTAYIFFGLLPLHVIQLSLLLGHPSPAGLCFVAAVLSHLYT